MAFLLLWSSCLLSSLSVTSAQLVNAPPSYTNGSWLFPNHVTHPTFNYLDTLSASWTSNFATTWLHLFCTTKTSTSSGIEQHFNESVAPIGSIVLPLHYEDVPFSCHFELSRTPEVGKGPPYVMGDSFYVEVDPTRQPLTFSQENGNTGIPTPNTTSNAQPTVTVAAAGTDSAAINRSKGPSHGAVAGIAIAAIIASVALPTAALFLYRHHKHNLTSKPHELTGTGGDPNLAKFLPGWEEMPATNPSLEKFGSPVAVKTRGPHERAEMAAADVQVEKWGSPVANTPGVHEKMGEQISGVG